MTTDFYRSLLTDTPLVAALDGTVPVLEGMKSAVAIPWPTALAPTPIKLDKDPSPDDPLPNADVLVVTWTSGEANTFAKLMTGDNFDSWYPYRHNVAAFIPKVTGDQAPFNDDSKDMARYYHTLGLYYTFKIDSINVVVLKSGLHMAYDGVDVPMVDLWLQMIAEVKPKLVITTGTGGGIGADIKLGDVLIAGGATFDLTGVLKDKPFAHASYPTTAGQSCIARMQSLITDDLLKPNGDRLITAGIPKMWYSNVSDANIVSTDTFAFDDSTDHFKLQGLGRCCDMGDATLGLALDSELPFPAPQWTSIRNASDPQIANTDGNLEEAKKKAENIYSEYQCITTAGSVIATWALIIAQLTP